MSVAFENPKQERINRDHLQTPRIGDYWDEMYLPICVVVGATDDAIVIVRKTAYAGPNKWTWDIAAVEEMPIEEWRKWMCYSTMPGKTMSDCSPGLHAWVRDAVIDRLFGKSAAA